VPSVMKSTKLRLLLVIILGFLAYSPMLSSDFKTADDTYSTTANQYIQDFSLSNIYHVFTSSFFETGHYYRPLVQLSFMMEYQLYQLNPFFYNLDNLLLHLLTAVILFFIILKLSNDHVLSFFVSLLFAVHPIHWESVCNVADRAIILCFFLEMLAMFFFLKGAEKGTGYNIILSGICFAGALLSKESAIALPIILGCYVFLFEGKQNKSFKRFVPYIIVIVTYVLIRVNLGSVEVYQWRNASELFLGFIAFARVNLTYLCLFVWPAGLHYDRAQIMFFNWNNPWVWATIVIYTTSAALLFRLRKKVPKIVWLAMCWYALEILPVSQVFATIGVQPGYISAAEHFLYAPSVGAFIIVVMLFQRLYQFVQQRAIVSARMLSFFTVCLIAVLFMITFQQSTYAKSSISMFKQSIQHNPYNTRILYALSHDLIEAGRIDEAEKYFRMILDVDPEHVKARIGLGKTLCDQGKCEEALGEYQKITNPGEDAKLLAENIRLTRKILRH